MAATVNHHNDKFSGSEPPEEDIAAIAKQISDHAEAIYQNWKSSGLAPTEILSCHSVENKFSSVLAPTSGITNQNQAQKTPIKTAPNQPLVGRSASPLNRNASPVMELLSSEPNRVNTNNLEQFVNKFVVEDKARIAAAKQRSPSPSPMRSPLSSSIQFALQKFERNCSPSTDLGLRKSPKPLQSGVKADSKAFAPKNILVSSSPTTSFSEYIVDPVVTSFPEHLIPIQAAPAMSHSNDGLSTWPLKQKTVISATSHNGDTYNSYSTLPANKTAKNHQTSLDQVVKEEERLINALKTGHVIDVTDVTDVTDSPESSPKPFSGKIVNASKLTNSNSHSVDSARIKNLPSNVNNIANINNNNNGKLESQIGLNALSARRNLRQNSSWSNSREMPHPDLPSQQRLNIRSGSTSNSIQNPVRPFLTRGSVAERVLIFEKCPTELILDKRKSNVGSIANRLQNYGRDVKQKPGAPPPHTTLQRHIKVKKPVFIPRFHFPFGRPKDQNVESVLDAVRAAFQSLPKPQATKEDFGIIAKACGCPLYWKAPLFLAAGGDKLGYVELSTFLDYWKTASLKYHDPAYLFLHILTRSSSRNYLVPEDFMSLVQDVVDTHPGLTFLKQAAEFHSRYVHTVISRIYYNVNQLWNGRISISELRRSDLLRSIARLEEEEDINQMTQYFSYEHFYVIYCKFWELDRDHDLYIDKHDLARHSDHALSSRMIDRIFSGTVTRNEKQRIQTPINCPTSNVSDISNNYEMSYTEFVWFLLAEEDKTHPRAIEYWFRCMDLDGDGFLSMYELEYFYDEQLRRMEAIGIECLPFEDCLCQMLDMIKPAVPNKISLADLKKSKMTSIFFDTFFNLEKYLDHEQRDPFASQREHGENEMSDWDRYAAEEYELLVAEEGGHENPDEITPYSDDETSDNSDSDEDQPNSNNNIDLLSPNLDEIDYGSSMPSKDPSKRRRSQKLKPDIEYMYITGNPSPDSNGPTLSNTIVVTNRDYNASSPIGLLSNDFIDVNLASKNHKWLKQSTPDFQEFDVSTDDSADYAADSDDCSL